MLSSTIGIRFEMKHKRKIQKFAAKQGESLASFVRRAAIKEVLLLEKGVLK